MDLEKIYPVARKNLALVCFNDKGGLFVVQIPHTQRAITARGCKHFCVLRMPNRRVDTVRVL